MQLLTRSPTQRIPGGEQGIFIVNKLPLFSSIDWELLLKKMVIPPFCPNSQKPNFDMSYDLEELLLENNPLESLPSKRTKKVSKMSADMLYLEESYEAYDFYATTRGRRHSVDYSAELFPGPHPLPPTGFPLKSLRRSSKSCADIHSMCKQGIEKTPSFTGFDEMRSPSSHLMIPSSSCSSLSDTSDLTARSSPILPKPFPKSPDRPKQKLLHPSLQILPPAPGRLVARSVSSPSNPQF